MAEQDSSRERSNVVIDSLFLREKYPISILMIFLLAAFVMGAASYHIFVALFGTPEALTHRTTHLTIFLILTFVFYPLRRRSWRDQPNVFSLIDLALILLTIATYVYARWDIDAYALRSAYPSSWDTLNGTLLIILILEAVRRAVGFILVFVPAFFFIHTLFSDHFFSVFYAASTSYTSLVAYLTMELDGIFGVPIAVASTFIIMFIFFGALLVRSGAGTFFTDLAFSFTGQSPGGPAKAAIFSSALYGTLSGSTTANVVTTGSFTIPLMKSAGFKPHFAASVEAIASNGGQIMPPVMGAAAFIIPFYIAGSSYQDVCLSAAIPAILYYFSLYLMIHFEARKMGLKGMPSETLPKWAPTLRSGWPLIISLAVIVGLLIYGFTPMTAGVWAILITLIITLFRRETRLTPKDLFAALETGLRNAIPIVMACAAAGIIIGSMHLSGLAVRVSSLVTVFSHGFMWVALIITMLVAILLGMGVTTTIIYITLAVMVVPSLEKMGVVPMAASLFVFYFGALSGVTPPVALTTYAAAGIAHSNPWRTGWEAVRIGLASFLIPFMFVFTPELLLIGSWFKILVCIITASLGVFSLAVAIQGFWFRETLLWERLLLGTAAFLLIHPSPTLGLLGLGAISLVFSKQIRKEASLK